MAIKEGKMRSLRLILSDARITDSMFEIAVLSAMKEENIEALRYLSSRPDITDDMLIKAIRTAASEDPRVLSKILEVAMIQVIQLRYFQSMQDIYH